MDKKFSHGKDRLADFSRDLIILKLASLAFVIGVMSAFIAYALIWLIRIITNLAFYQHLSSVFSSPSQHHLGFLVVFIPAIGGLLIGLMAKYGSEKIRGHGIPEALEAILIGGSRMEPKVAVLKPISSAISIGTGGPFGAEGPIIMTGGAFGSLFAQLFHLSAAERKTLLVAGAAAGMSAIFATPIAAVLLAVELLLFEWKPRSFIPVAIASIVAGTVRIKLLGVGPIFPVAPHEALGWEGLAIAVMVGIFAGLGSWLLTTLVYTFEDLFKKLPIHWMWWPAIGGLFVGLGGLIEPRVFGVGYDVIRDLLQGHLAGVALVTLLLVKAVVWAVALGSGTSGGVLAPLLIIGGALGAFESQWLSIGDSSLWAMISMAAVMGGTMRSPLTAILFTVELTHDFNLMPALLVGCIVAYIFTVLVMRRSILTEKVARRGHHITREYSIDPLELAKVGDVMDRDVQTIRSTMKVSELAEFIVNGDPGLTKHRAVPIVDEDQRLVGVISREDVLRNLSQGSNTTVLEAGNKDLILVYPDEIVRDAVHKMLRQNVGRLLVVSRKDPTRIIGYLGRPSVFMAWMRRMEEENKRESIWK
ncbi:MAG: chloride channel protein [Candidatus Omnitrophota bacterium]